jgi:hypothetical protein
VKGQPRPGGLNDPRGATGAQAMLWLRVNRADGDLAAY